MKYCLVDNYTDCIVDKVDLSSDVGVSGARTFFIGRKLMKDKEDSFDKIWKVMSVKEYNTQYTASLQNKQYEWWKEEEDYLDLDKP